MLAGRSNGLIIFLPHTSLLIRNQNKDARLVLCRPILKERVELIVEVKRALATATAAQIIPEKEKYILVTNYVNPSKAEQLQKMGVQFIDCAGNAYINKSLFFVFINGKKPEKRFTIHPARLYKPSGLQILFAVLCNPDLINAPYREIATKAGVALGTVAWAIRDLKIQGYILDLGNNKRRLVKKEPLLKTWLAGYEQLLRPKLTVTRYHAENPDWWQKADIENALWGGEIAAQKLTGYLKPQGVTMYAQKLPDRLMLKNTLRLDPHGEIEVLTPFWDFDYPEKKDTIVPPLLVYADFILQNGHGIHTPRATLDVKICATPPIVIKMVSIPGLALHKLLSWNDGTFGDSVFRDLRALQGTDASEKRAPPLHGAPPLCDTNIPQAQV